jgi:hypothetical protein
MNNEVVIFCESYPQIKNTLYIINENYPAHPITIIITGYDDLLKFFTVINEKVYHNSIKIVFYKNFAAKMGEFCNRFIKALYLFPDIVREKLHLRAIFQRHLARLAGADIYFSDRCLNPGTFYHLKKLYRKNRLVYMPSPVYDAIQILKSTPRNIFELAIWIRYKLVFGLDLQISQFTYLRIVPNIPDKFLERHIDRIINQEERVFNEGNYRVMYFHQDIFEAGYVSDAESFQKTIAGVFDTLSKYFPADSIALKYHPNSKSNRDIIKIGVTLPDFIPAEFLYDERIELYFGLYSLALANVTQGTVVSLMDMISFISQESKERLKYELLQWSHREILFPKSLTEFERILVDIKVQTV